MGVANSLFDITYKCLNELYLWRDPPSHIQYMKLDAVAHATTVGQFAETRQQVVPLFFCVYNKKLICREKCTRMRESL